MAKKTKAEKFPIPVKAGSTVVKIYRDRRPDGRVYFRVVFHMENKRQRLVFSDLAVAKAEASAKAAQLARGDIDATQLNGKDRLTYGRALDAVKPFDIPLDMAAIEYAETRKILKGHPMIEAARYYMRHHGEGITGRKVQDAYEDFKKSKTDANRSAVYLKDLGYRVADNDSEALVAFDFVDGCGFVGEGVKIGKRWRFLPRLERVGEVDSRTLINAKAVSGLSKLEADFHVGDGVRGHHQLEGVEAREEAFGDILIPKGCKVFSVQFTVFRKPKLRHGGGAAFFPFGFEVVVDDVDDFDEEGGGAGGRVEDLNEGLIRGDGFCLSGLVGEGREVDF